MQQVELIYRIVAIIFPVFSIVAIGYLYARYRSETDMSSGNHINMDVFIPALIFDTLSASDYALSDYLTLSLGGAVVVLGSGIVAWPVARLMGYQWKTFVPPMMFNNSGNMGVPLIILTFGAAGLSYKHRWGLCGDNAEVCFAQAADTWQDIQQAAEEAYDRSEDCQFTSFVGYEWTAGGETGQNLHHNVVFRNEQVPNRAMSWIETPSQVQLWDYLDQECLLDNPGCDAVMQAPVCSWVVSLKI